MKRITGLIFVALMAFNTGCSDPAQVKLPSVIGDNMVIQQGGKVEFWGFANPGETLSVQGSWQKHPSGTNAKADGIWHVLLDAPPAGGPYTLTFKGKNTVVLKNILCGEVWVCSGQSNMAYTLGNNGASWCKGVPRWENEVAEANSLPDIRLFDIPYNPQNTPQPDVNAKWTVATGENAKKFSAVGYLFAKRLNKELGVPVGMIGAYFGASNAQTWMNRKVLMADPQFKADALAFEEKTLAAYEKAASEYKTKLVACEIETAKAKAEGKTPPAAPKKPGDPRNKQPAGLYNGMIAPVIPFTIRGAIWYQGESNPDAALYLRLMQALIADWRNEWHQPQMPFYFTQLAPYAKCNPALREAQLRTMLTVPNTGMAVITDAGDKTNVHPHDKATVADRLARWALAKTYGKDIAYFGPLYKGMSREDGKLRISFDYIDGGLEAKGGDLTEFTIAGKDGSFVPARAVIDGDTVVVSSPDVNEPQNVRFAWGKWIQPNLYNKAGLPAAPFRTDGSK